MNMKLALALLAAVGCGAIATGCHHHLSYHDRVWDGWCGDGGEYGASCGTDCTQKASCCGKGGAARPRLLSKLHNYFWCANGCGEVYVGEWISDPPDCCDPCDEYYGCWTGPNDCGQRRSFDPVLCS